MLVLLEGPDGGGKTTLALEGLRDLHYQHNGPPPSKKRTDIFWWQLRGLMPLNAGVTDYVVDRSWPSDQVYHRFARRPNVFTPVISRMFERYLLSQSGVIVNCRPSYAVAYKTWRQRADIGAELVRDDDQFAMIYEHYLMSEALWRANGIPVLHYDYTVDGLMALREAIDDLDVGVAPEGVVGNPNARILIVGEQANVAANPLGPHLPFIAPAASSRWITNELAVMGLREVDLCWVNAKTPTGAATDLHFDELRHVKVIVALGTVAQHWVQTRASLAHVICVDHPAYWMRFCAGKPYPLRLYAPTLLQHRVRTHAYT